MATTDRGAVAVLLHELGGKAESAAIGVALILADLLNTSVVHIRRQGA